MAPDDLFEKQGFIFASPFLLANKLQILGDRMLGEFTTRQWFLTAVISKLGDTPPTLGEVAEAMGSSHQNVKQIALKLQEKGFLRIEKDAKDSRALRLILTEKSISYWQSRRESDVAFINDLFAGLSEEEINTIYRGLNKFHEKILEKIAEKIKK